MIDPTRSVPDREVLSIATQIFSDLLAVETHKHGPPSIPNMEFLARNAYQGAFALLKEHQRLVKETQPKKGEKK